MSKFKIDTIPLEEMSIVGWKYRKSEAPEIQGICVRCKIRKQKKRKKIFESLCGFCNGELYGRKPREELFKELKYKRSPYLAFKKDFCERCNFVAEHDIQLEVDHIDGNHFNNDPLNLQTLCANCHKVKTWHQLYNKKAVSG